MGSISPERKARLAEESRTNASNSTFYDLKSLTADVIRLTPLGEKDAVGRKRVVYFINKKAIVCNEETHQKPGVIAKAIRALTNTGDADALEAAKALRDSRRCKFIMKIVQRSNPTKVMWLEAPQSIYNAIFQCFSTDEEDISARKDGRDIRISKKGSGKDTEYSVRILDKCPLAETKEERSAIVAAAEAMDIEPLIRADEDAALEALKGVLPSKVWKLIAKEIEGDGGSDDGDDDEDANSDLDDEDETPTAGKNKAKKVEEDDEDEDADEKPAKSKAKTVDDEDEDEPTPAKKATSKVDDEEDEDAPPAKKTAAPPAAKKTAVVLDDEDEDAPPAKKKHQVDDEDEE